MRLVRITIEYDMDEQDKPLHRELADWLTDRVNVRDLFMDYAWTTPTTAVARVDGQVETITTIRINELDSQGEVK